MIYCFDLDGTICTNTEGEYHLATPFENRIKIINSLYDEGNKILIDSARGSTTGKNWYELTENQLKDWGVKYHFLRLGIKLNADYFIDDKGLSDKDFFENYNGR
jgi:hypothetical protein